MGRARSSSSRPMALFGQRTWRVGWLDLGQHTKNSTGFRAALPVAPGQGVSQAAPVPHKIQASACLTRDFNQSTKEAAKASRPMSISLGKRAQSMVFPMCRAKPTALADQRIWCIFWPDLRTQERTLQTSVLPCQGREADGSPSITAYSAQS